MKINLLFLILLCAGCTTTVSNLRVQAPKEPDYPVYSIKQTDSVSDKSKAIVMSWRDCKDYSDSLRNLIEAN